MTQQRETHKRMSFSGQHCTPERRDLEKVNCPGELGEA